MSAAARRTTTKIMVDGTISSSNNQRRMLQQQLPPPYSSPSTLHLTSSPSTGTTTAGHTDTILCTTATSSRGCIGIHGNPKHVERIVWPKSVDLKDFVLKYKRNITGAMNLSIHQQLTCQGQQIVNMIYHMPMWPIQQMQ